MADLTKLQLSISSISLSFRDLPSFTWEASTSPYLELYSVLDRNILTGSSNGYWEEITNILSKLSFLFPFVKNNKVEEISNMFRACNSLSEIVLKFKGLEDTDCKCNLTFSILLNLGVVDSAKLTSSFSDGTTKSDNLPLWNQKNTSLKISEENATLLLKIKNYLIYDVKVVSDSSDIGALAFETKEQQGFIDWFNSYSRYLDLGFELYQRVTTTLDFPTKIKLATPQKDIIIHNSKNTKRETYFVSLLSSLYRDYSVVIIPNVTQYIPEKKLPSFLELLSILKSPSCTFFISGYDITSVIETKKWNVIRLDRTLSIPTRFFISGIDPKGKIYTFEEVIDSHFEYWRQKVEKNSSTYFEGKNTLELREACLEDWININYAMELKRE